MFEIGEEVVVKIPDWFSAREGGKLVIGDIHSVYPEREMCDVILKDSVSGTHKIYIGMEYLSRLNGEKMVKSGCRHSWEITGSSPITGKIWQNCFYCNMKKEDL